MSSLVVYRQSFKQVEDGFLSKADALTLCNLPKRVGLGQPIARRIMIGEDENPGSTERSGDGQPKGLRRSPERIPIFDYIETFYNRRRRHSSLDMISPAKALEIYFSNQKQSAN